jgi:hypothetical protein
MISIHHNVIITTIDIVIIEVTVVVVVVVITIDIITTTTVNMNITKRIMASVVNTKKDLNRH